MSNVHDRLSDIMDAIRGVERYTGSGERAFRQDELVQTWVVHQLQVIGEACRALPEEFRSGHPEVDWSAIIGMRHIIVHHYFRVDLDIVWRVVEKDLPPLKEQIEDILRTLGE